LPSLVNCGWGEELCVWPALEIKATRIAVTTELANSRLFFIAPSFHKVPNRCRTGFSLFTASLTSVIPA